MDLLLEEMKKKSGQLDHQVEIYYYLSFRCVSAQVLGSCIEFAVIYISTNELLNEILAGQDEDRVSEKLGPAEIYRYRFALRSAGGSFF